MMKLLLLGFVLALSLQGSCASPENLFSHGHVKNPRKERQFYERGKGTIGWIASLALGPVGFVGVHIFSRNRTIRKNADKGFVIWITTAAVAGIVVAAVASRQSGGQLLLEFAESLLENWSPSTDKVNPMAHRSAAGLRGH
jgi:hypothetical protein